MLTVVDGRGCEEAWMEKKILPSIATAVIAQFHQCKSFHGQASLEIILVPCSLPHLLTHVLETGLCKSSHGGNHFAYPTHPLPLRQSAGCGTLLPGSCGWAGETQGFSYCCRGMR